MSSPAYVMKPAPLSKEELFSLSGRFLISQKIDGIRCFIYKGKAYSATGKPIPNKYIQSQIAENEWMEGLDGELIAGNTYGRDMNVLETGVPSFQETVSVVMTHDSVQPFTFMVFDDRNRTIPYEKWYLENGLYPGVVDFLVPLQHWKVSTEGEIACMAYDLKKIGAEGLILRGNQIYKRGRSTLREGGMLKFKFMQDREAFITGFEEAYSIHGEPKGELGAFICTDPTFNKGRPAYFNVGTGFTSQQRKDFWYDMENILGHWIRYSYLEKGSKDAPRHPSFQGFRPLIDIAP